MDFSQLRTCRHPPPPPTQLRKVLNRMKNQFSDFYCSIYSWLYLQFTGETPVNCVTNHKKSRSKVFKFTEMMRNELKLIINQYSGFYDFYFLSYDQFCSYFSSAYNRPKMKKNELFKKIRNVLKRIFEFRSFFSAIFSF